MHLQRIHNFRICIHTKILHSISLICFLLSRVLDKSNKKDKNREAGAKILLTRPLIGYLGVSASQYNLILKQYSSTFPSANLTGILRFMFSSIPCLRFDVLKSGEI